MDDVVEVNFFGLVVANQLKRCRIPIQNGYTHGHEFNKCLNDRAGSKYAWKTPSNPIFHDDDMMMTIWWQNCFDYKETI